ncbi:MAG TPA: sigma-70 family RNA polymerase sigma factor [Vicinamibacterales bacterium]|nr:sigma-70 family RNA polymerase sigma factor [Vicinamibacterales bacterium]
MSEDLPLAREDQHTISDEELSSLMCAAQQGDAAAYSRLLCEITRRVRRVVRQQRGFAGAAEVEDLVQDVLLSVHAVRASYDPERPFIPWLMAIVRNRLADGARRYARRAAREVQVDDIDVTFADVRTNTGESALSTEALQAAVQALPPGQRQAIELLKLREMSLQEASSLTGTSIGALKVATHRAMAALRRTLRNASRVQH